MQENNNTPLADEFMKSLEGITAAETNPFFYTRLRGRMQEKSHKAYYPKPAWAIIVLCFFLTINIWMIAQERKSNKMIVEKKSSVEAFAESYDLYTESNY